MTLCPKSAERCPTCGSRVLIANDPEGTSYYTPADRTAELLDQAQADVDALGFEVEELRRALRQARA